MKKLLAKSFDRAFYFTFGAAMGMDLFIETWLPWYRYLASFLITFTLIFAIAWIINEIFGERTHE